MAENNVSELIKKSLEGIRAVADSGMVLGEPINTNNGTVIIPVSKISVGFASGGVDYMPKDKTKEEKKVAKIAQPCFGGGGGTGISVTPLCFLVVKADGSVTSLNIADPAAAGTVSGTIDSVSSFVQKIPDLITKMKDVFTKKSSDNSLDDEILSQELDELKKEVEKEVEEELDKEEMKESKKSKKAQKGK